MQDPLQIGEDYEEGDRYNIGRNTLEMMKKMCYLFDK